MSYLVMVVVICLSWWSMSSAEMISSDPHFKKEGVKAYKCTTPKGRMVKCNRWSFKKNMGGWKKKCGIKKNQSPFSKLSTEDGRSVEIRRPDSGCVAMFDYDWTDKRDWLGAWMRGGHDGIFDEAARELKPAEFDQKVEVKEEGMYKLRACMASHMYCHGCDDVYEGGGIGVQLIQWHEHTQGMPTLHAEIPKQKLTYHSVMPVSPDHMLSMPEFPARGDVVRMGYEFSDNFQVFDGEHWQWAQRAQPLSIAVEWVDGHRGHAGLRSMYATYNERDKEAIWTCHEATVALSPGFYLIKGVAYPYLNDSDIGSTYEYDGFGAIRTIELNHIGDAHGN